MWAHVRERSAGMLPDSVLYPIVQLLGNKGPLDKRESHELFSNAAMKANVPVHAD